MYHVWPQEEMQVYLHVHYPSIMYVTYHLHANIPDVIERLCYMYVMCSV